MDVSLADENLVKEMNLEAEHKKSHPEELPSNGQFATMPYNNYKELLAKLIERIPDFNMHLKANQNKN